MTFKPTQVPPELIERLKAKYYRATPASEVLLDAASQLVTAANDAMEVVDDSEDAAVHQKPHAGFDAETETIKRNKAHPTAAKQHPFRPAQWTHPNGHPRCLMCGSEEPVGGVCNTDQPKATDVKGPAIVPVAAADEQDVAKIAAGIDAGVDQALVLLRSCNNDDLPEYAQQARDVLQGIEPACDVLLEHFGLSDPDDAGDDPKAPEKAFYTSPVTFTPKLERPAFLPESKAFVEEINGKTILTTQAAAELAGAMTNHEHYLWTQGRLVGADEANRNGAFWSSPDLELGQTTVPYGPLNWLHEDRHIIGSIAAASFSQPGNEKAADTAQNHIAIAAPIWRWLYPDEAAVVEMASEAGKFWYSMECISKAVQCVGDNGCGVEVSYFDYMQQAGATCEHMIQRSAVRRLVDPIFLGAAVIVPPARPGWADADATVARQAASLAEKAFDAAGRPDMPASEWEQLMAQVVMFAGVGPNSRVVTPAHQAPVELATPQPRRRIVKTVERDDLGNIIRIVEEE